MKMTEYSNEMIKEYIKTIEKINKILIIGIAIISIGVIRRK